MADRTEQVDAACLAAVKSDKRRCPVRQMEPLRCWYLLFRVVAFIVVIHPRNKLRPVLAECQPATSRQSFSDFPRWPNDKVAVGALVFASPHLAKLARLASLRPVTLVALELHISVQKQRQPLAL